MPRRPLAIPSRAAPSWAAPFVVVLLTALAPAGPAVAQDQSEGRCPHPEPVCAARAAVFPIAAFSPVASAVRLGPELLVTARHAVADETGIELLLLPDGAVLPAEAVPSPLPLDLVLLRVEGLPEGPTLELADGLDADATVYVVGADIGSARVEVFEPGTVLATPPAEAPLARLHHQAHTQPGNSGGALVDAEGRLVGIAVAGGSGRYEAIPAAALARLRDESGADAAAADAAFDAAVRACTLALEELQGAPAPEGAAATALAEDCLATGNRQFYDLAGQVFGRAGDLERATELFEASLAQDPQALNARLSLAITLHLARRFEAELEHLRWLLERLPADPQVLRLAVQAGKWGGDAELAERAYAGIERHFPEQAPAARQFLDSDAPAPR